MFRVTNFVSTASCPFEARAQKDRAFFAHLARILRERNEEDLKIFLASGTTGKWGCFTVVYRINSGEQYTKVYANRLLVVTVDHKYGQVWWESPTVQRAQLAQQRERAREGHARYDEALEKAALALLAGNPWPHMDGQLGGIYLGERGVSARGAQRRAEKILARYN